MWFLFNFVFFFLSFAFVLVWAFNVLRRNICIFILKHICSFSHDEKLRHVSCFRESDQWIFLLLSSTRGVEWRRERKEVIAKITQIAILLNEKFSDDWKVQTTRCIDSIFEKARLSHDANSSLLRFFVSLLLSSHKLFASIGFVFPSFRIYFLGFSFKTLDNLNPKESVGISTSCTTFRTRDERREKRWK